MSGSTSLTEVGNRFYLYDSSGVGPSLKYGDVDFVVGQFGQWTPIAAEQTATGYEVVWKVQGADQYAVWSTDSNGNYTSNILNTVAGTDPALESLETSFQQDLNGDGVIGAPSVSVTAIEAFGATSLTAVGSHFYLYDSSGAGPSLKFGGGDVVAGQFGQWTPIAAEQTATGYEVALKAGPNEYAVWSTDGNGNYTSNILNTVASTDAALELLETSFQQDLNGDGVIGVPSPSGTVTVVEAFGATSLTAVGNHFYLYDSSGAGPSLKFGGGDVVAGQFGQWTPIAAEQTATGYEVALKAGPNEYAVWSTDGNGNYTSNILNTVASTDAALESLETSFQQDLNGDGVIGVPSPSGTVTVVEAFGATSLTAVGSHFYLYDSSGAGPSLKFGGGDVVAGQFGQWTPIAAEQTATGYEVALKAGPNEYAVWSTDGNGNYTSNILNTVASTDAALESLETSFQQDLNGDGVIGVPSPSGTVTVVEAFGATSLTAVGSHFYLYDSSGAGPSLKFGGGDVVAGQFGQWTPIAAEQTATGYEVALKAGPNEYAVWSTDGNGNYTSNILNTVASTDAALESLETSFQQDLNGDGVIGVPSPSGTVTVVEAFGATSLTAVGNHFYLYDSSGAGPSLKFGGGDVVAGQFGQWTPIAAEQTATGYEVVLKVQGADQFTVWSTDSNGNYTSNILNTVAGIDPALKSLETSFRQDLNSDGVIGGPGGTPAPPQFVYRGTDSSGAEVYDVVWGAAGSQPFAVRVLNPDHPSSNFQHSFLYALPVEGGLAQSHWGSGLDELHKLDVQNQYNATIIEPIFPTDPWYADSANNATMNFETFMATLLPAWVDSQFSTSGGTESNLLVGFSKSGYGALDLLFKHASVFDAAAAWDFPADMTSTDFGGDSNYGTEANFQANYRLDGSFIDAWKASFTAADRIWISGSGLFGSQVSDFDALLSSHGVLHTLSPQTSGDHSWSGGWLSTAVAGLYGLDASPTVLDGHAGNQTLSSSGPSILIGGPNDILNGGPGADYFVFLQNFGPNTVNGFIPSVDTLKFSQSAFADAAAVLSHSQQVGTDVVITQDAQNLVTLHNVQLASLHTTDFRLV